MKIIYKIYKIINNQNGKIYIGCTKNDIEKRFKQHCVDARYKTKNKKKNNSLLHQAMGLNGEKYFSIELIEEIKNNINWEEREKYYIKKFNSLDANIGYNIAIGGKDPVPQKGIKNPHAKLSIKEVNEIINLLKESLLTEKEISIKYNVDLTIIEKINAGKLWHGKVLKYPIRISSPYEQIAKNIICDLLYTNLSIKEIGKKYKRHYQNISSINNGHTYKNLTKGLIFPLNKNQKSNQLLYKI